MIGIAYCHIHLIGNHCASEFACFFCVDARWIGLDVMEYGINSDRMFCCPEKRMYGVLSALIHV